MTLRTIARSSCLTPWSGSVIWILGEASIPLVTPRGYIFAYLNRPRFESPYTSKRKHNFHHYRQPNSLSIISTSFSRKF